MRLSRYLPQRTADDETIPLRRVLVWSAVALSIVVGLVLYFKFGRQVTPLIG